jgi:hypothetical protein
LKGASYFTSLDSRRDRSNDPQKSSVPSVFLRVLRATLPETALDGGPNIRGIQDEVDDPSRGQNARSSLKKRRHADTPTRLYVLPQRRRVFPLEVPGEQK